MRNYQKLKTLADYAVLDAPFKCTSNIRQPNVTEAPRTQNVLRMLVKPKYSNNWMVPIKLQWLYTSIIDAWLFDQEHTGIKDQWCYVTVRRGPVTSKTDDEWHFDGASFRVELIPERNYIWCDHTPTEYKHGGLTFPKSFDPNKVNLFRYAEKKLTNVAPCKTAAGNWYLLNPFCFHRRPPESNGSKMRTFVRISFTDVEGRDCNNTPNPRLPTNAYGRDPVKSFRNGLRVWK